jgi:hypothetical protein
LNFRNISVLTAGPVLAAHNEGGAMKDFGDERSGDWTCSCGQVYRVLAVDGEVQMWPEPIGELCVCGAPVGRGTVLSALYGAVVAFRSEGISSG